MGDHDQKWKNLKELTSQCRILSFFTFVCFGIASLSLIAVCQATLGGKDTPEKYDLAKLHEDDEAGKPQRDNVSTLLSE